MPLLILVGIAAVLWYQGKIPGIPRPEAVIPKIKGLTTDFPDLKGINTLIPDIPQTFLPEGTPAPITTSSASNQGIGKRTKTSRCVAANGLPDPACTPGAIFPDATVEQICTPGYSSRVRDVPESEKNEVYAEYDITHHSPGEYEVDHLISLELGGSDDIANLFPEAAEPRPGFHEKDKVENYLHDQVCSGAISLKEAQIEIATNWLAVYERMPK